MTEEEKAIELLDSLCSDNCINKDIVDTIKNLIEKQQKEIQQLRNKLEFDYVEAHYVDKDKIREKIKDLEKHKIMSSDEFTIKVLKALLKNE